MPATDLVERAQDAHLTIQAFHCSLIGDPIEPSTAAGDLLERVTEDSTEILDSLTACGLPTIADFATSARREDGDDAVAGMVASLVNAGGVLIEGTVPETRTISARMVEVRAYVQYSCLFWGPTFDEALAHAVAWAEGQYGKGGVL